MSSSTSETYGDANGVENIHLDEALSFIDNIFPKAEAMKDVIEQCKMDKQAIMNTSSKLMIQIAKLTNSLTEPCLDVMDKINETKRQFDKIQAGIEETTVKQEETDKKLNLNKKLFSAVNETAEHLCKNYVEDECMIVDTSLMSDK